MKRSTFQVACLFLAVFFTLAACDTEQRQHVESTLSDVESYINEHPDSALAVLQAVDSTALSTRALRARYSLLRTLAVDKCYEDITIPGLLDPAISWYEHHGSADERMKTLYFQGRVAQLGGDQKKAAVYYSRAEENAAVVMDKHMLGILYLAEASVFDSVHNMEKAAEYTEKGLSVFREINDPMQEMVLGQLAITYSMLKEWERADSLFKKGISASSSNSYAMSVLLSNYARMKVLQPKPEPEEAIVLLERMRNEYGYPLSLRDAGAYAYALTLVGKKQEAKRILNQLEQYAMSSPLEVESWLSRCASAVEDYKQAYEALRKAHLAEESEVQSVLSDSVTEAVAAYHEMAARQRRMQYRINMVVLASILLALSLILVLALLRKNKLEADRTRILGVCSLLEREAAEQENRTANLQNQLIRFREVARQERILRFRQAGKLRTSIWRLDHRGLPSWIRQDPDMAAIKEELSYVYNIDDSGEELVRRLDRELDGTIMPLLKKLNMLDKSQDQLFLCCCLLDLPSDVVAERLGITPNNVRVKKHRLKEQISKLDDPEYDALFDIRR